tara:strand:+ start:292 stop:1233 length:942 start_codon:yes stop_codon:yes gene_type:complete
VALPSSPNQLTINQIAGEFGGTVPHSLSEYYAGGGLTPSGTSGDSGAIPTSGEISIGQFYGSSNRVTINLTISSPVENYQISASRGGTYRSGITDTILTTSSQVSSTSVGTAALWTGPNASWATGDTIRIVVSSSAIKGRGGDGGGGAGQNDTQPSTSGQPGGDAIEISFPTTLQNTATIRAGGGGGGGSAGGRTTTSPSPMKPPSGGSTFIYGGGGGGGGAGDAINVGLGGAGGSDPDGGGQPGQDGGAATGGAGGDTIGQQSPNGGDGGSPGNAGSAGQGGSPGGAAGKAIEDNGYTLTLQNSGTIQGATT